MKMNKLLAAMTALVLGLMPVASLGQGNALYDQGAGARAQAQLDRSGKKSFIPDQVLPQLPNISQVQEMANSRAHAGMTVEALLNRYGSPDHVTVGTIGTSGMCDVYQWIDSDVVCYVLRNEWNTWAAGTVCNAKDGVYAGYITTYLQGTGSIGLDYIFVTDKGPWPRGHITYTYQQTKDELLALLKDPNSNWSALFSHVTEIPRDHSSFRESGKLDALAELDAQSYVKTYPGENNALDFEEIGRKHALGHGLSGDALNLYAGKFMIAMERLTAKN